MLNDVISIRVMSNIFNEASCKLNNSAKQLYENVLNHYFADKEEIVGNLIEFTIRYDSIPNYETFKGNFTLLQKAGLIVLQDESILFLNVWSKHIHLNRLNNISFEKKLASIFKDEMLSSSSLIEAVAMKSRINKDDVMQLLNLFFAEQEGIGTTYSNENECRKHFIYWSTYNIDKIKTNKVSSKSKILGNE